jgi:hypothetical protein
MNFPLASLLNSYYEYIIVCFLTLIKYKAPMPLESGFVIKDSSK